MLPGSVGMVRGWMMEGGGDGAAWQGVWYSMSPSPEVSAMHVIFGRRAQQWAQEIGVVPRCGGRRACAHQRLSFFVASTRRLPKLCGQLGQLSICAAWDCLIETHPRWRSSSLPPEGGPLMARIPTVHSFPFRRVLSTSDRFNDRKFCSVRSNTIRRCRRHRRRMISLLSA